jgi:hypothetical protein
MDIAIIGGGWVGCHLAYQLKDEHNVTIYEKNSNLFSETSYNNQNRLHVGYHYARNQKTRKLCEDTFDRFINDYGLFVKDVPRNYYCVPYSDSVIDFGTFKKIYHDYSFEETRLPFLKSIEGSVQVNEKYISFKDAQNFFNKHLSHLVVQEEISENTMMFLSYEYDLVLNCTNNFIRDIYCDSAFYELALTLVYEQTRDLPFDAITLVDGDFFSIYPYSGNLYSVSDVEFTPLRQVLSSEELKNISISDTDVQLTKNNIENKILKYFPDFNHFFKYHSFYTSVKSKYKNQSADRYPVINGESNIIHCFTGKIQGIYIIEDYVKEYIDGWEWSNRNHLTRTAQV